MPGLVIVSHSHTLAAALAALAQQVSGSKTPIAFSGGAGDDFSAFGTDTLDIVRAIKQADHPDGVLVLMDLGSAVLSAQTALDLLPEDMRARVRLCPAPLVEGAVSAAVQASTGADLDAMCREAQSALTPKYEHLGISQPAGDSSPTEEAGTQSLERSLTLVNPHGLHARPAAHFVRTAAQFEAEVRVRNLSNGKGPVSARSLNALTTLGAVDGHRIAIQASGPQAAQALEALASLVEAGFGERESAAEGLPPSGQRQPPVEGAFSGIPIAEGIAFGRLYHYQAAEPLIPSHPAEEPEKEWARLQRALQQTAEEIRKRQRRVARRAGEAQAAIFEAHALLLQDPALLEATRSGIEGGLNAAAAWQQAVERSAAAYDNLEDAYLQQRGNDVRDVGRQVLLQLTGGKRQALTFEQPVILVAEALTPTETAQLDLENVVGIATVQGGPTSHSAILARALGIPAVGGLPAQVLQQPAEGEAILDGFEGRLWLSAPPQERSRLQKRRAGWLAQRKRLLERSRLPASTQDGRRVEVAANAGSLEDAHAARQYGAEGIGLLRTEFLFLTRLTPPDEEEQMAALQAIGAALEGRPVIVRTLDSGGDKPLPYLQHPEEANPFLGTRAIRLGFLQEDLFRTQLRALLRAGVHANLRLMFPMVATLEEVQRARALLESVHEGLQQQGIAHRWPIESGIMVEIPAAALCAEALAAQVDFFSIGTNDLTQYTLAAERGNPNLEYLSDGLHPAVLRLIQQVVQAAHAQGKWVGVCGELAGDPEAVPLLVGLGVDELSLNPAGIPQVKEILRRLRYADAQRLAEEALQASNARQVRQLAAQALQA